MANVYLVGHEDLRIKLLPIEADDDYLYYHAQPSATGSNIDAYSSYRLIFSVPIPAGYKATAVQIYSQTTGAYVAVYECNIVDDSAVSKATGQNTNSEFSITEVTSTSSNYLSIQVASGANDVYGGYVKIAPA
jgi:hypothetical protein